MNKFKLRSCILIDRTTNKPMGKENGRKILCFTDNRVADAWIKMELREEEIAARLGLSSCNRVYEVVNIPSASVLKIAKINKPALN